METEWMRAAAGGLMIGSGTLVLLAGAGHIAGISGIAHNLLTADGGRGWRLKFLAGLLVGGIVAVAAGAPAPASTPYSASVLAGLVGAGLLVGFGTRIGNGCTSGHGICGLSQMSPRSIAATVTFMAVGMITATALRSLWGV